MDKENIPNKVITIPLNGAQKVIQIKPESYLPAPPPLFF